MTSSSPKLEQSEEKTSDDDDEMTQKYIDLKVRMHELEETNESLYQQLLLKDNEIEKLIISTPTSPPAEDNITIQPLSTNDGIDSKKYTGNDVYGNFFILLVLSLFVNFYYSFYEFVTFASCVTTSSAG